MLSSARIENHRDLAYRPGALELVALGSRAALAAAGHKPTYRIEPTSRRLSGVHHDWMSYSSESNPEAMIVVAIGTLLWAALPKPHATSSAVLEIALPDPSHVLIGGGTPKFVVTNGTREK